MQDHTKSDIKMPPLNITLGTSYVIILVPQNSIKNTEKLSGQPGIIKNAITQI